MSTARASVPGDGSRGDGPTRARKVCGAVAGRRAGKAVKAAVFGQKMQAENQADAASGERARTVLLTLLSQL